MITINEVNNTKIKHSRYEKFVNTETYLFEDLSVKIEENGFFFDSKPYLNKLKPVLYYEWSKRKHEGERGCMIVICMAQRHERHYTTVFFNNSYYDTTDFLKQIDERNEELNQLYFINLKLSFMITEPEEEYEISSFKKELCELKAEEIDFQVFLLNETHPEREYNLISEEEIHDIQETTRVHQPKEEPKKIINSIESYKSDECVICYNEKPNVMFCNCGHLCLCEKCNESTTYTKCSLCRQESTIKRKI